MRLAERGLFASVLLGLLAAIGALVVIFLVTLAVYGLQYFEWGFWSSMLLSFIVILAAYVPGSILLLLARWAFKRSRRDFVANFAAFGVTLVCLIWGFTEIPWTAALVKQVMPEGPAIVLASTLAWCIALALGALGRDQRVTS
jgi:hypothetical protein